MKIYTCDPDMEVCGSVVASITDNLASERHPMLRARHGFAQVDVRAWYPLTDLFAYLNDVAEHSHDDPLVFVAMGIRISEQSEFPAEMRTGLTLTQIIEGWQAHYEANHQGGYLPPVQVEKLGEAHYCLTLAPDHLYPYDLVYGMLYGFCKQLLPPGMPYSVSYGQDHTLYEEGYSGPISIDVKWQAALSVIAAD